MTNNIVFLDFNGIKINLDGNTKLVRLSVPSGTAVDTTFHNTEDDTNYQVPASKKATVVYVESYDISAGGNCKIVYADDVDGVTNAVDVFAPNTDATLSNFIYIFDNVPTGKYINFDRTTGSAASTIIIYVVEEDA